LVQLDVAHAFDVAGGPLALRALLDRYLPGHNVTYPTVQMWRQRATIPGPWIIPVLYVLHREGHDWIEFCEDDTFATDDADQPSTPASPPASATPPRKPVRKKRARVAKPARPARARSRH
jgi:hypothetical protein